MIRLRDQKQRHLPDFQPRIFATFELLANSQLQIKEPPKEEDQFKAIEFGAYTKK